MDDPVGELHKGGIVGGYEQGAFGVVNQVAEQGDDGCPGLRVELTGRLVSEQQPWPGRQRPGDRYSLLLAAGQLGGSLFGVIVEADGP